MSNNTDKWAYFYKNRVNSKYQSYFEKRYKPFLKAILDYTPSSIIEEGIGIGSVSKYFIHNSHIICLGYDINEQVLELASKNLDSTALLWKDNILQPESYPKTKIDLAVTHGVLEHFSDLEILSIFERYKRTKQNNIHYVPLDKYQHPSFGDERLLPYQYWLELVKPKDYLLFNDNHDLILIN